jgi:hypothetical protein
MPKLIVAARQNIGFIRAGRRWGPTPTEVEVDEKTAAILRAEPMLVVVEPSRSAPKPPTSDGGDHKSK